MINVERLNQAIQYVTANGYVLSSSLFSSYYTNGKKTCCVIRAAAIAANANANNIEDLCKGAATFLKVSEQEVWAFVDGLEGRNSISFNDENKHWLNSRSSIAQNVFDRIQLHRLVKFFPFKKILFKTLFQDFHLGQMIRNQFEYTEVAAYLIEEGMQVVA